MAFPTRHFRLLQGNHTAGQRSTIAHGLRDGRNGTTITPNAVLFEMGVSTLDTWANQSTGKWAADDTANIYLSNWDSANAHRYSVVVRSYYSDDSTNF